MNIPAALIIAAAILWSTKKMSEALTSAVQRLTTEVTETINDVTAALREAAGAGDLQAMADAINAQADRLDQFQATLTPGTDTTAG